MKKSIYAIAIVLLTILASSCTEENITPKADNNGTGETIKL